VALFSTTLSLLFIPKILSMVIVLKHGARAFGGVVRLAVSVLGEMIVSALLAPIRMLFHTQFVTAALAGHSVQWKSPPREDAETSWGEAFRRHGWQTLLGMAWAGGVYWLNPAHVWWLLPVAGALILSIPVGPAPGADFPGARGAGITGDPAHAFAREGRQSAARIRACRARSDRQRRSVRDGAAAAFGRRRAPSICHAGTACAAARAGCGHCAREDDPARRRAGAFAAALPRLDIARSESGLA
jgi:membrane glycosyltransferase